ncbi:MAG: glycosyltransferase family 1 protein [Myxococcales bacterium]|nr:glycosyltransferase family 1 protein [Myxococcales bacterium]
MARLLFYVFRESGHVSPTIKLARALAAAGHELRFLVTADWAPVINARGFEAQIFMESVYPAGTEARWRSMSPTARAEDAERRRQGRMDFFLRGAMDPVLTGAGADLILADVCHYSAPMIARRHGLRLAHYSTTMLQARAPGIPPLSSGIPWRAGDPASAAAADDAWAELLAEREAARARDPYVDSYVRYVEAMADAYAYPRALYSWEAAIVPDFPEVPQLVLCPAALDYPRATPPRRELDVPSIEPRDDHLEGALAGVGEARPLVYCALGSQVAWRPAYRAVYDLILAAAARMAWVDFVISVGPDWVDRYREVAPANAIVVDHAPQHALLRRARAMIGSAGLGSVKECASFGVPMLLIPGPEGYDPPGNAARASFRGVARVLPREALGVDALVEGIEALLGGEHDEAARALQREVAAVEAGIDDAVARVERLISGE